MKRPYQIGLALVLLAATAQAAAPAQARHVNPKTLDQNTAELFRESMDLSSHFWDENAKLVKSPANAVEGTRGGKYMVRESSWYALGLLLRDAPGDRKRAADILDAVLKEQYLTPGVRWYGTYKRTPEEPDPTEASLIWRGYDPNWRVFIGTTFAMILIEFPDRVPAELAQKMYGAIDRSIDGEIAEGRLLPSYTNIALMYGFLWDFAAVHNKRADWQTKSAAWNESVYALFKKYNAFFEYNSPTYCGVDLYGLALWRDYGSTARERSIGSEMEASLWRELANYYQPNLRNISGPFDRAYGMDMEDYVSVVGVWMRSALDAATAPLPKPTPMTDHLADLWFAPHIAILGTRIPADAMKQMTSFAGERLVHKQIDASRVATAWIGRDVIFGGEATNKTKDAGTTTQFHPATVQWRTPSGEIGWVQLVQCPPVDATADAHGLTISTSGTVRLRIHAKDLVQKQVTEKDWQLPGLHIAVNSDAKSFSVEPASHAIDLVYSGIKGMRLDITTQH
ncbi:MAG TPA: hypothetical protein VGN01_11170 [Acidobacteriaceae bacterium]|jgi:hypothetical protein